nr:unnamed protein product [Digitaria exilis]
MASFSGANRWMETGVQWEQLVGAPALYLDGEIRWLARLGSAAWIIRSCRTGRVEEEAGNNSMTSFFLHLSLTFSPTSPHPQPTKFHSPPPPDPKLLLPFTPASRSQSHAPHCFDFDSPSSPSPHSPTPP